MCTKVGRIAKNINARKLWEKGHCIPHQNLGAMDYVPGKEKGTNLGANFRENLSLQEKSGWGRATSFNITKS